MTEVLMLTSSKHRNILTYTKHVARQTRKAKADKITKALTMEGKFFTSEHVMRLSTVRK
jgi:hypothetical protein